MLARKIAVVAVVCALLCGCYADGNGIQMSGLNERADGRFAYEAFLPTKEYDEWQFGYVIDTETGVAYLVYTTDEGRKGSVGGITPLLNRDGTPVIDDRYGTERR